MYNRRYLTLKTETPAQAGLFAENGYENANGQKSPSTIGYAHVSYNRRYLTFKTETPAQAGLFAENGYENEPTGAPDPSTRKLVRKHYTIVHENKNLRFRKLAQVKRQNFSLFLRLRSLPPHLQNLSNRKLTSMSETCSTTICSPLSSCPAVDRKSCSSCHKSSPFVKDFFVGGKII